MESVICLLEQEAQFEGSRLPGVSVSFQPMQRLAETGWAMPLITTGDVLRLPSASMLIRLAYRAAAPMFILPPFPIRDLTNTLSAPAPVSIISHAANQVKLKEKSLKRKVGRDKLVLFCMEAVETPLSTGVMATAAGRPVVWAYQPTKSATAVVLVTVQLMLTSARSDPLDREALIQALLTWAREQSPPGQTTVETSQKEEEDSEIDRSLLRAIVVGLHICPDLTEQTLPEWLRTRLFVPTTQADVELAITYLQQQEIINDQKRPIPEKIDKVATEWHLQAWIREAKRNEASYG